MTPTRNSAQWALFLATWTTLLSCTQAAMLDVSDWIVRDDQQREIPHLVDNRLVTAWVSDTAQTPGMHIDIDLGAEHWVHRLYMTPYTLLANYPRRVHLYAGTTRTNLTDLGEFALEQDIESDLRFSPLRARHLRVEIAGEGAGYPWAIAEILAFGFKTGPAVTQSMCVIKSKYTDPLSLQAEKDLSYYLTELARQPVPLLTREQATARPGPNFEISITPMPERYEDYIKTEAFRTPETGKVERKGSSIVFSGHSPRGAMYAAYEFLHQQGVRWVFPSALGDYVPDRGALDTSLLPLETKPAFSDRYANWNSQRTEERGDDYLWYFRNRWSRSWGGRINDRPGQPQPRKSPRYGYTHTFGDYVKGERFETQPEWFPVLKDKIWIRRIGLRNLGKRIPYSTTWGLNFCTSTPEITPLIANKIIARTDPPQTHAISWVTPMDAGVWCECKACQAQDDPSAKNTSQWRGERSHTTRYMHFITNIASRVSAVAPNVRIGAFAYEDYIDPAPSMAQLPDNIVVDVIQYGYYNLPLTSPSNRWMRVIMNGWSKRWPEPGHLGVYDWALLTHMGKGMPVPLVRAATDRIKFWHRIGVRRIGTQADAIPELWRANPWNFYAYSRLTWDVTETTETLLSDFFEAYYREAAEPMRAYYSALEDHLVDNDIALGDNLHYGPHDEAFPVALNRQLANHLTDARRASRHWMTAVRVRDATESLQNALLQLKSSESKRIGKALLND